MSDIQTELDNLDPIEEHYVLTKSQHIESSLTATLQRMGVSRPRFYTNYNEERRAYLDDLARRIHRDNSIVIMQTLTAAGLEAAQVLINLMSKSKSDYVKYQAAAKVIEYVLGTPQQRIDHTSAGEQLKLTVEYVNGKDYS